MYNISTEAISLMRAMISITECIAHRIYPEYNIQPQEYGGIRLVNGMNNYPSAAGIDIDLDVAEDLKTAYQAVERGMVINSGMLGGVNYGHAQNAEASVTNSCMLWALDTMGQLANEMPTLFRWVHGSAK